MGFGSYCPLAPAWLGARLAGSAYAANVASGPKKAANHIHALIERPRLTAIRPAINIEMNPVTMMVAVIMLQLPRRLAGHLIAQWLIYAIRSEGPSACP